MNQESPLSIIKEIVSFIVLAAVIVVPIRIFIAQPFIVSGESMYPTFDTGDYLIVDQISYHLHNPNRGDVAVFKYPENPSRFFIKRVIGLPGETVEISGKEVFITDTNGDRFKIDEPYIKLESETNKIEILEDDEYFVMGDNRLNSLDSRSWGPLGEDFIIGRAFIRLLPITKLELLPGSINY